MADSPKDRTVRTWRREEHAAEKPEPASDVATEGRAPVRRLVRRTPLASPEALAADVRSQAVATAAQKPPATRRSSSSALDAFRARMGKVPDEDIAKEAGVTRSVVGAYRRKHGIAAYEGYLFKPGHVPLTGKPAAERSAPAPATQIARQRTSRIDEFAHLAGVESDASIAKKAGVTPAAVTAWRHRRGIAAANKPGLPTGRPPSRASALDAFVHLFGTMSDPEIAERAGVKRDAVIKYRKKNGIPAWNRPTSPPPAASAPAPRTSPLDGFVDKLGTMSDADVAKLAGATREAVGDYRRSKGIAPWQGFRTKPRQPRAPEVETARAPAAEAAASVAETPPSRQLRAYTVVATANGAQREFIAIGEDIAVACAHAQAALEARDDGPWVVDLVKFTCDALG